MRSLFGWDGACSFPLLAIQPAKPARELLQLTNPRRLSASEWRARQAKLQTPPVTSTGDRPAGASLPWGLPQFAEYNPRLLGAHPGYDPGSAGASRSLQSTAYFFLERSKRTWLTSMAVLVDNQADLKIRAMRGPALPSPIEVNARAAQSDKGNWPVNGRCVVRGSGAAGAARVHQPPD